MSHKSDLISEDILAYLKQHENKELLRFLTCGNVDDGKSTLIGRLLFDSKMIFEDQLAAIENDSTKHGTTGEKVDLALLVDGLAAEREQGITIDVAYRYFSTDKRKFIIADTPGHEQYTRNMATGASTCDLAIILVDARYGVQTQTKRHSFIASLLGIKHVVVAVNKMDLMDFDEKVFNDIKADYEAFSQQLDISDIHFVPLSALDGDNVVTRSERSPWYKGKTLMEILEKAEINADKNLENFRFPVQYVNRPNLDFRGFCGTVASGIVRPGDEVTALPSGKQSKVKSIVTFEGNQQEAFIDQAVTITLEDEIDVSRGDMLVKTSDLPQTASTLNAEVVWMSEEAMKPGKQYDIKFSATPTTGSISRVHHRVDVNTLEKIEDSELKLNEIGLCELTLNKSVAFDPYKRNRATGAFIIIDRLSNVTVGAGMIVGAADANNDQDLSAVTAIEKANRFDQKAASISFTGENKHVLAAAVDRKLFALGRAAALISKDDIGKNKPEDMARIINQAGLIALCTFDHDNADLVIDSSSTDVNSAIADIQEKGII
ncbi:sulfate adenylyltransferase subunit CysN [Bermanella marisrubri]|uniref:Sulfate adenylyltransferase subunit 1 n=1 Tax=Bermanella marisrubri TaxID=207949 RepID=Q1N068_9GAMM|nr:sulfate adenylyltransferase subunit CysN [Bermanella marisrubri]EAT11649.1 bifunctional sulfate adenylyltransferase subunit 1/adenylylsulfate kinase protein [Oceanobacter sp. RED65] [Bermanella marisrubri]QIZ83310.1 sulfate adenylyltransferase subunit CysN [Bermanella marisrubri]